MTDLINAIREQFAAAWATPWPLLTVVAVITLLIWRALDWAYGRTIANRDETITHLREQQALRTELLADAKAQLDEQNQRVKAIEADIASLQTRLREYEKPPRNVIPARHKSAPAFKLIELRERLTPRRLADGQKVSIALSLIAVKGTLEILSAINADDAEAFRDDLKAAFFAGGWDVRVGLTMAGDMSRAGLIVCVRDPAKMSEKDNAVIEALTSAGIEFDLDRSGSEADVQIRVVKRVG